MTPVASPYPQVRKMRCPYCGWVRTIPLRPGQIEPTLAPTRSGNIEEVAAVAEKILARLAVRRLEVADGWVEMPGCPHCDRTYQYNVITGAARP